MTRHVGPSAFRCLTQYTDTGWWVVDGWTVTPYGAIRGVYGGRGGRRNDPHPKWTESLLRLEADALASTEEVRLSPVPVGESVDGWGAHLLSPDRGCYLAIPLARVILGTPHDRLVWVGQETRLVSTAPDVVAAIRDEQAVAFVAPCYGKLRTDWKERV